jgi:membrane protein required for colicin V production
MNDLQSYLNITDICAALLLLFGMLGGLRRGLSGELLRIISIAIAIVVGWKGTDAGAVWIAEKSGWPVEDVKIAAFLGLIVGTYIFLAFVRLALRLFVDFAFKGKLEHIGGALVGLTRSAIFATVALLFLSLFDYEPTKQAVTNSVSGDLVIRHVRPLYDEIARKNPDLKLPLVESEIPDDDAPINQPAFENYLGPLIEHDEE